MIQLAQGKLALVAILVDVKVILSSNLVLLLRLQRLGLILHSSQPIIMYYLSSVCNDQLKAER